GGQHRRDGTVFAPSQQTLVDLDLRHLRSRIRGSGRNGRAHVADVGDLDLAGKGCRSSKNGAGGDASHPKSSAHMRISLFGSSLVAMVAASIAGDAAIRRFV